MYPLGGGHHLILGKCGTKEHTLFLSKWSVALKCLVCLKNMVADSNLSHGFVVSTSRTALLLPVTTHEVRVRPVRVIDPPGVLRKTPGKTVSVFKTRGETRLDKELHTRS